jgi:hypothetical protein
MGRSSRRCWREYRNSVVRIPLMTKASLRCFLLLLELSSLLLCAGCTSRENFHGPEVTAEPKQFPPTASTVDWNKLGIAPVPETTDPKTGFKVAGTNSTALIRQLTEINGRTIAALEDDMRPGKLSEAGFLGPDEKLLTVMAEDNRYVVEERGLTHCELARHLRFLASKWDFSDKEWCEPFYYQGRRFQVCRFHWKGIQESPFRDGTQTSADAMVRNLDNGKEVSYSLLVPDMIERYGFYEGKGTKYRVEPQAIIDVLDFLKHKSR